VREDACEESDLATFPNRQAERRIEHTDLANEYLILD
jgi:hypothetical protein